MRIPHQSRIILTETGAPMPSAGRKRPLMQPRSALGPALLGVAKTAATSAAITAAFGGLVETFAPHGQRDVKRTLAAMQYGGGIGGGVALGVALPNAIAATTGAPLGVVVGVSLMGVWTALRILASKQGR